MKLIVTIAMICMAGVCMAQNEKPISTKEKEHKQGRSPFRKVYLGVGLYSLGAQMNYKLSPVDNLKSGNWGSNYTIAVDFGHIFYFNRRRHFPIKFGLDWTIFSVALNGLDWNSYLASNHNYTDPHARGSATAVSLATKLGPVLSFNPIGKLVIDVRAQVALTMQQFDMAIDDFLVAQNIDVTRFAFDNDNGVTAKPSFGITLRHKVIGFSWDYSPGTIRYGYSGYDGNGQGDFKINNSQLKLSFFL